MSKEYHERQLDLFSNPRLQGVGVKPAATIQAFEMALRKGVRHIDLEITNGGANGPLVGGARLEEVVETIKKAAFITSEFPLFISLDVNNCNLKNQAAAKELLKDILGSSLLTGKMGNPEKLPSPEQLKRKIILSARVDRELSEEPGEGTKEHPIGEVWYLSKEEDEKEEDKSKRGWKKRDVILRGDALSFHAQTSAILTKMTRKPFFVGAMSRTSIENFINALPEEKTQRGTFLMYCNPNYTDFKVVVCKRTAKPNNLFLLHLPIQFNEQKKMIYLDTELDRTWEHKSIDKLVKFYQHTGIYGGEGNMISLQTNLDQPIKLQGTNIHKHSNWYKGNLDDATTSNIMASVHHKGAFLVREPEEDGNYCTNFFIEYFDGINPQKLVVSVNLDESEVTIPNVNKNFDTITEVVNYFKVNYIGNATKLCEPIQLVAEIAEEEGAAGGVQRNLKGTVSIKRISRDDDGNPVAVDRNDERHAKDRVVDIKTKQIRAKQSEDEEHETTLKPGVRVEERDLDYKGQLLRFSHNKKIVISRPERDNIELTKGDDDNFDVDILLVALQRWTQNTGGEEMVKTDSQLSRTTLSRGATGPRPLAELVVYCKERKAALDMTQVVEGKTNTKLRQFKQTGLLKMMSKYHCLNYTDITSTDMERMLGIVNVNTIEAIIQFHENILSKVFPLYRMFGQGDDPKPMWLCGAQLVALNHQAASSTDVQTNNAMFASNGSCGYVLKPNVLLTGPETSCIITLKIIEARHLRTLKHINEQLFEPHIRVSQPIMYMPLKKFIQVSIEESEQREVQVWDTEREPRDRKQKKHMNGFHTVWDAKFGGDARIQGRVALNKNVAFLKFVLTEVRLFLCDLFETCFQADAQDMKNQLGQCTLRLANIRPGLRRIVFRNERDNKENLMAIALVEIRMYSLGEIEEKTEIYKARIEVWNGLT